MSNSSYVDSHKAPGKGRQYDEYYATDAWGRYLWSREQEVLTQALEMFFGSRKDVRALDFACGTDRMLGFLGKHAKSVTGVDISPIMVEVRITPLRAAFMFLTTTTSGWNPTNMGRPAVALPV